MPRVEERQHHEWRGDGNMAEEGRLAAHRLEPWPEEQVRGHNSYGAADNAERVERQRKPPQDRVSAILGGIAVVALVLGLAQVVDMGGRRSVAEGQVGNNMLQLKAVARRHTRMHMLQGVEGANGTADANTTAVSAAERSSVVGDTPGISECCECPVAAMPAAGNETADDGQAGAEERAGNQTAGDSQPEGGAAEISTLSMSAAESFENATAPAAEEVDNATAPSVVGAEAAEEHEAEPAADKSLAEGQILQRRKLLRRLQQDLNASAFGVQQILPVEVSAVDASETAADETAAPETSLAAQVSSCCLCSDGPAERIAVVDEDWGSSAMPRNAWDSVFSVFKYVGKDIWGRDGYKTVHDLDGERLVPSPEESEHILPTIGPRDIVVPSLEFEGTQHNGGWAVTSDFFGDGRPHQATGVDETEHELNSLVGGDKMIDQRITHMKDPANWRGHQLPGVTVDWSKIPHPADAAKEGPPTTKVPHIVHHSDGTIEMETEPAGSSIPYRSGVRQMVFKPCKKHPIHGCELEPPMPIPTYVFSSLLSFTFQT